MLGLRKMGIVSQDNSHSTMNSVDSMRGKPVFLFDNPIMPSFEHMSHTMSLLLQINNRQSGTHRV